MIHTILCTHIVTPIALLYSGIFLMLLYLQFQSRDYWYCILPILCIKHAAWWRHQMETFSALLAICAGNTCEFPAQRPVTRSFDIFFIWAWMNSWVNNRDAGDLRRHHANYGFTVMDAMAWKRFPHCFVNDGFPHKGQVKLSFDISMQYWTECWSKGQSAGDLRHHNARVTIMKLLWIKPLMDMPSFPIYSINFIFQ